MEGGCFTDIVLYGLRNYHQEHATEPRRLPKSVAAALGVVILHFHEVIICVNNVNQLYVTCIFFISVLLVAQHV